MLIRLNNNVLMSNISILVIIISFIPVVIGKIAGVEEVGPLMIFPVIALCIIASILVNLNIKAALFLLVLILSLQPIMTMLISEFIGGLGVKILVASKDIFAGALLSILFLKNINKIKFHAVDYAALVFLLIHVYHFWSPVGIFVRVLSFREGFMIIAYYFIGRLLLLNRIQFIWVLRMFIVLALFVAIFGFIERFIFSEEIWNYLGALEYEVAKKGEVNLNHGNLVPGKYFTFIGAEVKRRMVATIGDAASFSRFLSFPMLIIFYLGTLLFPSPRNRPLMILIGIILASSILLSFGRGGLLICIVGLSILLFNKKPVLSLLILIPGLLLLAQLTIFDIQSGSAFRHITGFMRGYNALVAMPLGHGLGTSGGKALYYAQDEVEEKVSESYFGSLAYQLGLPGLITYFAFFILMIRKLFVLSRNKHKIHEAGKNKIPLLAFSLAVGIFSTSMLAQSAVSPISAGLSLVFCGLAIEFD